MFCNMPDSEDESSYTPEEKEDKEESFERVGYWNKFYAEDGDELDFYEWYSAEWLSEEVVRVLEDADGCSVLDVGCGTSPMLFEVAQKLQKPADRLLGVDFAVDAIEFMCEQAANSSAKIEFEVVDVGTGLSTVADRSIDVVVDKGCLDCFVTGAGEHRLAMYLSEIARVLKDSGRLLLVAVNFADTAQILATGTILADRFVVGGEKASASALERRKRPESANEGRGGAWTQLLHIQSVRIYQQKHLYICGKEPCGRPSAVCGLCGECLGAQYPDFGDVCPCGNHLRRFALS
mmetsp:Transcript_386/g.1300  ORF Transcript_386/g.1300 Transcript_386/m.1300 type:complete len:292 (+) Transcript_386:69-944(+)